MSGAHEGGSLMTYHSRAKVVSREYWKEACVVMWDKSKPRHVRWNALLTSVYMLYEFPSSR